MLLSPLLLVAIDKLVLPRYANCGAPVMSEISESQAAPVIIAGFGRYGQIVGRMLQAAGSSATVLDHDPEQIEAVQRFGYRIFYGDATRLDLLRIAGAGSAKVIVVAIDNVDQSIELVKTVQEHFPNLQIVARARNVTHWYALRNLGVVHLERETFESALQTGSAALQVLGHSTDAALALTQTFRTHNLELLEAMRVHHGDQTKLVALAKQGRAQLEEMLAKDRARSTSADAAAARAKIDATPP
jgi:glutathione-regulated potassium-efflux system ancillary protein KefC